MWLLGQDCTDFSNCDTRALVAPGTWNLNSAGMLILTVSPALAGGFLSTCTTRDVPDIILLFRKSRTLWLKKRSNLLKATPLRSMEMGEVRGKGE